MKLRSYGAAASCGILLFILVTASLAGSRLAPPQGGTPPAAPKWKCLPKDPVDACNDENQLSYCPAGYGLNDVCARCAVPGSPPDVDRCQETGDEHDSCRTQFGGVDYINCGTKWSGFCSMFGTCENEAPAGNCGQIDEEGCQ